MCRRTIHGRRLLSARQSRRSRSGRRGDGATWGPFPRRHDACVARNVDRVETMPLEYFVCPDRENASCVQIAVHRGPFVSIVSSRSTILAALFIFVIGAIVPLTLALHRVRPRTHSPRPRRLPARRPGAFEGRPRRPVRDRVVLPGRLAARATARRSAVPAKLAPSALLTARRFAGRRASERLAMNSRKRSGASDHRRGPVSGAVSHTLFFVGGGTSAWTSQYPR